MVNKMIEQNWDEMLYRQALLGKSRYRFLERGVIKSFCPICHKYWLDCKCKK